MNYQERQEDIKQIIAAAAEPILSAAGVELVDINVSFHRKDAAIDILADKPNGGITIEECSSLNREISREIEEGMLIEENYSISVSSPGLDRPLKTKKDFLRVVNKEVEFLLSNAIENIYNYCGVIQNVTDEAVTVLCQEKSIIIPLRDIKKAVQFISIK